MWLQLSPALRNRFTEIWCPLSHDADDYVAIIEHNIRLPADVTRNAAGQTGIGRMMVEFTAWFQNNDFSRRYADAVNKRTAERPVRQDDRACLGGLDTSLSELMVTLMFQNDGQHPRPASLGQLHQRCC